MLGQISIFDILEPNREKPFSWDSDINEIHKQLKQFTERHGLEIEREAWSVWDHVPQFGFRMSIGIQITRQIVEKDAFWDELNEIVQQAKVRKVELSPFQPFFFGGSNTTTMSVFTTFMDNERRKRRN